MPCIRSASVSDTTVKNKPHKATCGEGGGGVLTLGYADIWSDILCPWRGERGEEILRRLGMVAPTADEYGAGKPKGFNEE